MSAPSNIPSEFFTLLGELADEQLSDAGQEKLLGILRDSDDARTCYLEYMELHARLQWKHNSAENKDTLDWPVVSSPVSAQSSLASAWALSYMVATVVLAAMLLGAWAYKISHVGYPPDGVADNPRRETHHSPAFVGRITGMKECRWAEIALPTMVGAHVPLNREYELASGLLEITYDTGARVILEGPCEYTVDSAAGGRLQLGKLVVRVEKRGEAHGGLAASAVSANLQAANHNPSSLTPHPSSLFSVTTPMAIVTDLGTEFGVEVSENGDTSSFVFQGSVLVEIAGEGGDNPVVLHKDESAVVRKTQKLGNVQVVTSKSAVAVPSFVRRLRESPVILDVLDIVAGGNGLSCRRELGIDPHTGKQDASFLRGRRASSQKYMPVDWNQFVDGVFIPKLSNIPTDVQLDSVGHTFSGFPPHHEKSGPPGRTVGSIWAREAEVRDFNKKKNRWDWIYSMARCEQFMPERRGLLCLHANAGITFDLEALRKVHEGLRPVRFRAVVGLADASEVMADRNPQGTADLWMFVDGELKQKRLKLQPKDGGVEMSAELGPNSRFLTLVTSDSADGSNFDWGVWGDPVLEMTSTDTDSQP